MRLYLPQSASLFSFCVQYVSTLSLWSPEAIILSTCNLSSSDGVYVVSDKGSDMPDHRRMRQQDRARINMGEDSEVEYWANALGVSRERLVEVVAKVGDSVQAVRRELHST